MTGSLAHVCLVLASLCTNAATIDAVAALGAVDALLEVMEAHTNNPAGQYDSVLHAVCRALRPLCERDSGAASEALQRGALPVAQAALLELGAGLAASEEISALVEALSAAANAAADLPGPHVAAGMHVGGSDAAHAERPLSAVVTDMRHAMQRSDHAALIDGYYDA